MAKTGVEIHRELMNNAFDSKALAQAMRENAGPMAVAMIDTRTRKGEFLGGPDANKGYSTNPIASWKLGKLSRGSSGTYILRSDTMNTSAMTQGGDLKWYTKEGKRGALFMGGYRRWRELTGRGTGFVNLTFTGAMLRALTYAVKVLSGSSAATEIFVNTPQAEKAAYTDARRNWIGLNAQEEAKILKNTLGYIESQMKK